jgi:MoaA/NifB/PqqE/SkfB family radical SAM enzyme
LETISKEIFKDKEGENMEQTLEKIVDDITVRKKVAQEDSFNRFNKWKSLIYSKHMQQIAEILEDPINPKSNQIPYPVNWHIYASNVCPYKCNFCIMKNEKSNNQILSRKILYKAVDDAQRIGVKLLHFSGGGEPLTNRHLSSAIKRAKANGLKVALSTNGYYLNRLDSQVDHLRVSFNAGTKQGYLKTHGVDGYERVKENIEKAVKDNMGIDIGMGFVVTPDNCMEVDEFVKVAEDCGVNFVHIRPAYWPSKNLEIIEAMNNVKPKSDKLQVFSVTGKFDGYWNDKKYPCRATPMHAVLAATGDFLVCQDRFNLRFGDYNNQSFDEIWFSKAHFEAIKGAQNCGIRCVECRTNELIQKVFVENNLRMELI